MDGARELRAASKETTFVAVSEADDALRLLKGITLEVCGSVLAVAGCSRDLYRAGTIA
jgi:hypothetical protein